MHGNIWELCEDDYVNNYEDTPRDGRAYKYMMLRIVKRGGSWGSLPRYCCSATRHYDLCDYRDDYFGFRVVCVVGDG